MATYGVLDLTTENPMQVTAEGEAFWPARATTLI
jgi:hypothetical protein